MISRTKTLAIASVCVLCFIALIPSAFFYPSISGYLLGLGLIAGFWAAKSSGQTYKRQEKIDRVLTETPEHVKKTLFIRILIATLIVSFFFGLGAWYFIPIFHASWKVYLVSIAVLDGALTLIVWLLLFSN